MTSLPHPNRSFLDRPAPVLAALIALSLLVRIPFLSPGLANGDSVLYCQAILQRAYVAHPPGYMGYVVIGTFLDWLLGNAYLGLVLLSALAHLAMIPLTYILAREAGLSVRAALLAAAALAASVNLLFFGGAALNYVPEGLASLAAAVLIFRAVRLRHAGWALAATIAWAAAGVIRPTTTVFLAPLWIYMMWRAFRPNPRIVALLACILLGGAIVKSWQFGNSRLLALKNGGVAGNSFVDQAYMGGSFDYTSMDLNKAATTTDAHSYHWPWVEIVAWVEDHAHIHLMPRPPSTPAPSLGRAFKLMATQGSKLAFYIFFSAPLLLLVPLAWELARRKQVKEPGVDWPLLWVYLLPALLFFLTGHFGVFGYLLVILPGLMVLIAAVLSPAMAAHKWLAYSTAATLAASVLFFVAARPIPATSNSRVIIDILALQYTGFGVDNQIGMARNSGPPNYEQLPAQVRNARGDAQILDVCLLIKRLTAEAAASQAAATQSATQPQ
jgi:hypothetical protein